MGIYDERRVEPRTVLVGKGMGNTKERIEEIEQRVQKLEKSARKEPIEPFGVVLARRAASMEPAREQKEEGEGVRRRPRPGFSHPAQREAFGRDEDGDEEVVLKG